MQTREWRFTNVSPAEAGDFFQITFSDNPDSIDHYVLLSTQFEFPQNYDIQVEVDGGEWHAQLTVTQATLSRTTLTVRAVENREPITLIINYAADEHDFSELVHVAKIMFPDIVMLR